MISPVPWSWRQSRVEVIKVRRICWKGRFWAWSEGVMDDESGDDDRDEWGSVSRHDWRVVRLKEWTRELIPETGWCISEWAICDFCRTMRCISTAYVVMRCLFVCHVRSFVKMNKNIFELFSPSGSHTIWVIPYQTEWRYSDGNPPLP